jgi:hypothetical protein
MSTFATFVLTLAAIVAGAVIAYAVSVSGAPIF